jgi:DNA-binding NtrC family response regulator
MSKPVIVVISRDQMMASELPGLFQGQAEIRACVSLEEFIELARHQEPSALLADFRWMSDGGDDEVRTIESVQLRHPNIHLAMVTPHDCPENLVRCASTKAITHLRGHLDRAALLKAFGALFQHERTVLEVRPITHQSSSESFQIKDIEAPPLIVLTGISRRFETWSSDVCQMLSELEAAAKHDVTILLIGETGSGISYLSRLIHEISSRRHEPFLTVSCGALPNDSFDRELYGHNKGALSGKHHNREGKFLEACRGTIVLDEIDTIGLPQQVQLLRVIESGEFKAVGSSLTNMNQSRLILASSLSLQPLVEHGRFKSDLYYRLNVMSFVIPALRHRKTDIAPLAHKFVRQHAIKHGITISGIDSEFLVILSNYPWPGNVRELEQVIERAVILCRGGRLERSHLPPHLMSNHAAVTGRVGKIGQGTLMNQLALNEKEIIEQSLFQNRFIRTNTATQLGISRITLYNKMKKYGLKNE